MRLFRPLFIAKYLFPKAIFRIKTSEKLLSLTFDDGPDPASTPSVLEIINRHNVKAVFFCNGNSAQRYPELIRRIISGGHLAGNHGFSHFDGFKTPTGKYLEDTNYADSFTSGKLFRPPYGRMRPSQYHQLVKQYKIVMWDLMAYDFDKKFGKAKTLEVLKKYIRPGSIVVLHDKPGNSLNEFLEEFIIYSLSAGYRFEIPSCMVEHAA